MILFELRKQREHAQAKAESIISAAESAKRELTPAESLELETALTAVKALTPRIQAMESKSTMLKHFPNGQVIIDGGRKFQKPHAMQLSDDYAEQFFQYIQSGGKQLGASLYEGSNSGGGYAVPVVVDNQIVPLAPNETGVRKLATVMPTLMDIKLPVKATFGAVALKPESGGSTNIFTESDPTLSQVTLSAFMIGGTHTVSWELAQDVPAFQAFAVDDLLLAQGMYEENLYVNGTGSGQPQGLLGNVGAGVTGAVPDGSGNLLSVQATFDVQGTLNAAYHPGASWLMTRASGVELRKAQMQSNLFAPVFVTVGGKDYLHGYPVEYSSYMPAIAAGATPVLFGDFKRGYVIGDRGGSGINVKVLDQPLATAGQLILLAYRRSDGRVRRSEAIQGITLHT